MIGRRGPYRAGLRTGWTGVVMLLVAGLLVSAPTSGHAAGLTSDGGRSSEGLTGLHPAAGTNGEGSAAAEVAGGVDGLGDWGVAFEANRGQFADDVAFAARHEGGRLALTRSGGLRMGVAGGGEVGMALLDGDAAPGVRGRDRTPGATNYLHGDDPEAWVQGVPSFREVVFEEVYAGVDLVWRQAQEQAKYDLIVTPGADPEAIRLGFDGVDGLAVDEDGDLRLDATGGGQVVQRHPYAYQTVDGEQREVAAEFAVVDDDTVTFELGDYDPARPLIIDPEVAFSTFVGGSQENWVRAVAVGDAGDVYAAGSTGSVNFPTTDGAYQENDDDPSGFVVKYSPEGEVDYATYFDATPDGVAVDDAGRAHLSGGTFSDDFPTSEDAHEPEPSEGDGEDAFVARLNASGTGLDYATYLHSGAAAQAIAVDADGSIYVGGVAVAEDLPTTADAYQDDPAGGDDVFVAVFDADGDLDYATYLGGSDDDGDEGDDFGLDIDDRGRVHVGGTTKSADFPTTGNAVQGERPEDCSAGCNMAFVGVLDPSVGGGDGLVYASYLGGEGNDRALHVAAAGTTDAGISLVVAGRTNSCDFPTTEGAYRTEPPPGTLPGSCAFDQFVARLDVPVDDDSTVEYATRLGFGGEKAVAVDAAGRAHLVGTTSSDDFPTTDDAFQRERRGGTDVFVTVLAADGSELEFSTLYGGSGESDEGWAVAVGPSGAIVTGGRTLSPDFPTSAAAQEEHPSDGNTMAGWVARFTVDTHPLVPVIESIAPDTGPPTGGTEVTVTGQQLADATEVAFGAAVVPCPSPRCTIDSDQRLTVTAPAHPQRQAGATVAVTAANQHGRSPAGLVDFLYGEGVWEETALLGSVRFGHTATVLPDGHVLVAGCHLGNANEPDLEPEGECPARSEVYDPLDRSWSPVGAGDPTGPAVLLDDGGATECGANCAKVLVVACAPGLYTPCSGHGGLYNPSASVWEPAAQPAVQRLAATAARLDDGRVLTTGDGHGGGDCTVPGGNSTAELFDPLTGAWTSVAGPHHGRSNYHTLTALPDGTALAVGGWRAQHETTCPGSSVAPPERFHPDALGGVGAWRETADQGQRRYDGFSATLVTGGTVRRCGEDCDHVMIAGGRPGTSFTTSVELYDPDADAWAPTGSLPSSRSAHTATELPTGKVLVTGGHVGSGLKSTSAQVYDPVARRWRSAGRMDTPRGGSDIQDRGPRHTATVISSDGHEFAADPDVCGLDCGKVLLVGGSGDASAELYTPAPVVTGLSPGEADAAGGATVTIEGAGFTHGVREVRFGGQSVDCSALGDPADLPQAGGDCRVIDYSTLEVEVPAAAGALNVPVEVVTDAGFAAADEPFIYTGAPGRVDDLAAEATSASQVALSWSAVGQTWQFEPPAGEYVVVHSGEPIGDADDFDDASVLCGGVCDAFDPSPAAVGDALELIVGGLAADTTHHFAVAAVDPDGRRGPVSDSVSATTLADDDDGDGDGGDDDSQGDGDGDDGLPGSDDGDGGGDDLPGFDDDGDGGEGDGDAPVAPLEDGVLRLAGADRIATAVAASREAFADGDAGAVVVARADVFADGLAGVPLAAAENAPLLLTGSDELDSRSQAELERVLAGGGEVFLLGGTAALSDAVEQQIAALGYTPTRLAGPDRFATAVAIAEDGLGAPDRLLVTTGGVFADAVTAGAAGARHGAAVVLTAGDQLPVATADYLARHQPAERIAVGGPAARAVADMAALVGATRFETAATVADALFAEPATVGVATGLRFPDALSGGAHVARYQGPMLLSGPDRLHPAAADYLASRRAHLQSGVIYGGTAALSPAVEGQFADALP